MSDELYDLIIMFGNSLMRALADYEETCHNLIEFMNDPDGFKERVLRSAQEKIHEYEQSLESTMSDNMPEGVTRIKASVEIDGDVFDVDVTRPD